MITGQRVRAGGPEPAQRQHGLPKAGQRPAAARGAAAAPLGCQQLRNERTGSLGTSSVAR